MKITKRKLRSLIKEAIWNPHVSRDIAAKKQPPSKKQQQKIDALSKSDPEYASFAHDSMTDYDPDSPLSTGSSYEDTANFDKKMMIAHETSSWQRYYDNLAEDEKAAFDLLLTPSANVTMHIAEDDEHPDRWDEELPGSATPMTHPGRFYLEGINTNPTDQLRDAVNKVRPWPNGGYGVDSDEDAIHYLIEKAGAGDVAYKVEQSMMIWLMTKLPNMNIRISR